MNDFFVRKDIVINGRQNDVELEDHVNADEKERQEERNEFGAIFGNQVFHLSTDHDAARTTNLKEKWANFAEILSVPFSTREQDVSSSSSSSSADEVSVHLSCIYANKTDDDHDNEKNNNDDNNSHDNDD